MCLSGAFVCAMDILPFFNKWLQIVPFPNEQHRSTIFSILIFNVFGTFLWDRIMVGVFAPKLLIASFKDFNRNDYWKLFKSVAIVALILYWVLDENVFLEIERQQAELERMEAMGE